MAGAPRSAPRASRGVSGARVGAWRVAPSALGRRCHGLGQAADLSGRGRCREFHACWRVAEAQPVGDFAPDRGARGAAWRHAVPQARARPDPHRAGRIALSHRTRHGGQSEHRRGAAARQPGQASGPPESHDHGRFRVDLADRADARIHHHVPRHRRQPGAVGQRARPRHARGRCRHPHDDAPPARPGAAPSADGAQPCLRLARLYPEVRQAAGGRGTRPASSDHFR